MKTALVTGAGSGLGALTAQRLAAAGWAVVAVDLDETGLARTALRAPTMHIRICDVTDAQAVAAVVAEAGPVQRVVNAAAIGPLGVALEQPLDQVERTLEVNFLGTVHVVRAALPGMLERGSGELVLFSSLAGWVPVPKSSAYAASKAAVNAYAEVLVQEYGGQGVKIRCVCPRQVDTPMLRRLLEEDPSAAANMKGMPPRQVLDAIDRSLAGPDTGLYVFPGALTRLSVLAKRHIPALMGRLVARLTA